MGVNDKVRTDLDLHKWSNLGMAAYASERSYPTVGVGQIWKQYHKQFTRGPWWPCNAHLSIITLWEPDLELIKANILIEIQNDYINK